MTSLRRRLFIILVAATGLIWLCGFVWIAIGAKAELEHVLDTRLQEAAKMVNSLVGSGGSAAIAGTPDVSPGATNYERQLSCQIWSLDGHLLARSGSAPEVLLTDSASGFSDRSIKGETWRVYAIENAAKGVRVMIGDRLGLRDQLVADLVKGLMIPALLIVPLLGGLIWVSLGRGLRPLRGMADELQGRDADDMRPIDAQNAPSEIRPLADALNGLFVKVETARQHEREVTAFAAHELRTPLAGLKTQAQIAMAATDPAMRQGALDQILVSVDRTSRLVRQLLALAKLDAGLEADTDATVRVGEVLAEIIDALRPRAGAIQVTVDPALHDFTVRANRESLSIALRNLHENAVQHTPAGGTVSWSVASDGHGVVLEDEGPGIPDEELPLVSQRFFRGKHRCASGCGLGLTIVAAAIRRTGGTLTLENRKDRSGVRAMIVLQPLRV
jgi:two-component system, OmpR family, sensor histidine kinase QseC